MKRSALIFALVLVFMNSIVPVLAQDAVMPPENARILARGAPGIRMEWPGSAKEEYFVQIYAGQVVAVEQRVTGNSIVVPLRAGLGYQWQVNLVKGVSYLEVVPPRNFQIVAENQLVFTGKPGGFGSSGTIRRWDGSPGGPGMPGPTLSASLNREGSYVKLEITGAPANRLFYFAPDADPFVLAAVGGPGGTGGTGRPGLNGIFDFNSGYIVPPEPGGHGGDGGDGGPGGFITVNSNGLNVPSYLSFNLNGGPGGAPGRGGPGGTGVIIPPQWRGRRMPQPYGYGSDQARSGQNGAPGQTGAQGRVVVR